jgi:hypothetical protein
MALDVVGLGICGVCFAGLWPFESRQYPRPNFSSRNLTHAQDAPSTTSGSGNLPVTNWGRILLSLGKRVALLLAIGILAGEAVSRITIHWRESAQELLLVPTLALSALAALWAGQPVLRRAGSRVHSVLLWLGVSAGCWFVSWAIYLFLFLGYLAPNLGLYSEPDWMIDNAGWQRQYRVGVARHLWQRKLVPGQFSAVTDLQVKLDDAQQMGLVDLDSGRQTTRGSLGASEMLEWARNEKLDLVVWMKAGHLSVDGLDLAVVPVNDQHWDKDSPQDVADYWLLERNPTKATTVLWPRADHWHLERHLRRDAMPGWMLSDNRATYYFRTREGNCGMLQLSGDSTSAPAVQVRFKRVQ